MVHVCLARWSGQLPAHLRDTQAAQHDVSAVVGQRLGKMFNPDDQV